MTAFFTSLFLALHIGPAPVHLTQPPPLTVYARAYYPAAVGHVDEVNAAFAALYREEGGL